MPRPAALRCLLALFALLAVAAVPASAAVPRGPSGTAFYTPPRHLPGTTHGALVRARPLTGAAAIPGARSNRLVMYRSRGVRRRTVAVTGIVAVPKRKPPKGGWPVVTWAPGTVGIADVCAPSRDSATGPAHDVIAYILPLLQRWLGAGYAVVRTDYAGLGTPGVHPFLNGRSEGRGVLDIVRAARKLDHRIGRRVVIGGHSQGGQAALFAAALAPRWTPELRVRGTVTFAPITHLSDQLPIARNLTQPSNLSAYVAMITRGLEQAVPSFRAEQYLTERALALYPQTLYRCLGALNAPDSFRSLSPSEILRSDVDFSPLSEALDRETDAENLRIRIPVRVEQGADDTTVFRPFVDQLVRKLRRRGARVTYRTWEGATHGGVVVNAADDATNWIRARLG